MHHDQNGLMEWNIVLLGSFVLGTFNSRLTRHVGTIMVHPTTTHSLMRAGQPGYIVHALVLSCAQLVRSILPHFSRIGACSSMMVSLAGRLRVRWVSTVSGHSRAQKGARERG